MLNIIQTFDFFFPFKAAHHLLFFFSGVKFNFPGCLTKNLLRVCHPRCHVFKIAVELSPHCNRFLPAKRPRLIILSEKKISKFIWLWKQYLNWLVIWQANLACVSADYLSLPFLLHFLSRPHNPHIFTRLLFVQASSLAWLKKRRRLVHRLQSNWLHIFMLSTLAVPFHKQ